MKTLSHLKRRLERTLEWIIIFIMAVLVVTVLWQVISRYIFNSPSSWTEELAKILLVWGSLLGATVAYSEKSHLGVDYFVGKLSVAKKTFVALFVHLVVGLGAGYIFIYGGLLLLANAFRYEQTTAALKICYGYVYLALPICGFFFVIIAIEFVLESIATIASPEKGET